MEIGDKRGYLREKKCREKSLETRNREGTSRQAAGVHEKIGRQKKEGIPPGTRPLPKSRLTP